MPWGPTPIIPLRASMTRDKLYRPSCNQSQGTEQRPPFKAVLPCVTPETGPRCHLVDGPPTAGVASRSSYQFCGITRRVQGHTRPHQESPETEMTVNLSCCLSAVWIGQSVNLFDTTENVDLFRFEPRSSRNAISTPDHCAKWSYLRLVNSHL